MNKKKNEMANKVQLTQERPSAKDMAAVASSMAKSTKEKDRRNAAFSWGVGLGMRVSLRTVKVRIRSKCWIRVLSRY